MPSIHKAAAIIINDRKLLVERSAGKEFFVAPGGKLEKGESVQDALARELLEELGITINDTGHRFLDSYFAKAANNPDKPLQMDVFFVDSWQGEIIANEEQELAWITSENTESLPIGSIFEQQVIPFLKQQNIID